MEGRTSALKNGRSENVLVSSPLVCQGLKAAKVEGLGGESSNVSSSMVGGGPPGIPPQFPSLSGERVEFEVDAEVPGPLQSGETAGFGMDGSGYAAGGGNEQEDSSGTEEPSMKDMMKFLKKMDGKFDSVQVQFSDFRAELQKLKADMVTKEFFSSLEVRVVKLENLAASGGGLQSGRISWMQQQVNRFDPANKSLSFGNMKETEVKKRAVEIQNVLKDQANDPTTINFNHVWKGKPGNR